jgi:hypothetical protein
MSEETLIVIENWGIFFIVIFLALGCISYLTSRGKKEPTKPVQSPIPNPFPESVKETPPITVPVIQNTKPGLKLCFYCKGEIPAEAMVCMHCSRDNRPEIIKYQAGMERANLWSQLGRSLLIIAAMIFLALWLLGAFRFF